MTTLIDRGSLSATILAPPTRELPPARPDDVTPSKPGSISRRLLERFALIAFGLYHLPLFLNNYPSLGGGGGREAGLAVTWGHVFTPVGIWVAQHILHLAGPTPMAYRGDNGDVSEEFARLFLAVVIAIVVAAYWTWRDRRRPQSRWVGEGLRVLLRYSIALGLISYAVAKILPVQFPAPEPATLELRLGEMSPMALLWRFMGYSRAYAFFGGVMEIAVVLLLFFRRTTTLGALLCLVVMTNVALLNYAYGVPVKLYATMIVASAAVLIVYDFPRLRALFLTNKTALPAAESPLLAGRIREPVRWALKVLLVGSVVISSLIDMVPMARSQRVAPSATDGGWVVTAFSRDGQALDSTSNPARWRRFTVSPTYVMIRFESDSLLVCGLTTPSDPRTIAFQCRDGRHGRFQSTRTGNLLQLRGEFDGRPVTASGRHLEGSDYRLLGRRFHWIDDI